MIFKRTCRNCNWDGDEYCPIQEYDKLNNLPCALWTRRRFVTLLTIIIAVAAVAIVIGAAFLATCLIAANDPRHNAKISGLEIPRTIVLTNRHYVNEKRWIITRATVIDFYRSGYRMTEVK